MPKIKYKQARIQGIPGIAKAIYWISKERSELFDRSDLEKLIQALPETAQALYWLAWRRSELFVDVCGGVVCCDFVGFLCLRVVSGLVLI